MLNGMVPDGGEYAAASEGPANIPRLDLRVTQALVIGVVVAAFPLAAIEVFVFAADRAAVAGVLAVIYSFGTCGVLSTAWWPFPSLRGYPSFARLQLTCFLWFWITYTTHCTWELAWLVLRDRIIASRNAAWAYAWWAYIDGGDRRFASTDPTLYTMEILSVSNGLLGFFGLWLWYRSGGRDRRAVLLFMATAVVHLYSTILYYGAEIGAGLPNVNTASFLDLWVKFGLANSPWLVLPWAVLFWGWRTLLASGRADEAG